MVGNAVGAVGGGLARLAPDLAEAQTVLRDRLAVSDNALDELEPLWTDPEARAAFVDAIASAFGDGTATVDDAGLGRAARTPRSRSSVHHPSRPPTEAVGGRDA